MKESIFNEVLQKVAEVTGIDPSSIIHSNKEECTDARYILIKVLLSMGFTENEVSGKLGCKRQAVNYAKNHFDDRLRKWSFRVNYGECKAMVF
jgi:hypothetical protein